MPHMQPEQYLTQAATAVDQAVRLLARPDEDGLANSSEELANAQSCLGLVVETATASQLAPGTKAAAELARLRHSLMRARGLIEHAQAFWGGWTRFRNALTTGYTALGQPAEPPTASRLSLEG